MAFLKLEKKLNELLDSLEKRRLIDFEKIKSEEFLNEINKTNYLITLHDVEFYRPICINNTMAEFYGFDHNWFSGIDYLYYLKTIHTSTYNTLFESISFFRKDNLEFLNLKYKLLYHKQEWKTVIGTTKTILRKDNKKPKYAITLSVIITRDFDLDNNYIKSLTKREREIVSFLCLSYSKKEISNKINISEHTVRTHTKNIYKKLKIGKIAELINMVEKYSMD